MQCGNAVGAVQVTLSTKVTGERALDGDASSVGIANLADEDHVGVLSQDGFEACRKREAGLLVRLDLVDAREDVLHRVLDRRHVLARRVDSPAAMAYSVVVLPAPVGPGADDHAERRVDHLGVLDVGVAREAELGTGRSSSGPCRGFA